MTIVETSIREVLIIKPDIFSDDRGYFFESFRKKVLDEYGIKFDFVQDNISKSKMGTIRGLHYQAGDFKQGKLCQVIYGSVLDAAVDIRFGSPTFSKYVSTILSEENHSLIWIPPGFAHGFSVLSDEAIFHYKCTEYYDKESERAILYNDPDLNIDWKVKSPIVSPKDLKAARFKDIAKDFIYP
ncbi:MAG: dTDP-4-dehydrorhamnose 3,5-epimerase [Chlorobi bacterium]|nr:dTDP-4-dehydrorhamnose 3,5-epimerase [Chlorobiota bacterium]MCI0717134.1 dTDP-4-dehydrorhamnose 3,5-epimerase [Chlorobiota bacterium]